MSSEGGDVLGDLPHRLVDGTNDGEEVDAKSLSLELRGCRWNLRVGWVGSFDSLSKESEVRVEQADERILGSGVDSSLVEEDELDDGLGMRERCESGG